MSYLNSLHILSRHARGEDKKCWVSAAILGGAALASGAISGLSGASQSALNRRWQLGLSKLQHGYELENLYRERDVNKDLSDYSISPSRFASLGLNPHLAVMQGAGSVGSASAGTSVNPPDTSHAFELPYGAIGQGLGNAAQGVLQGLQIDKELELKDQQAKLLHEQGVDQNIRNRFQTLRQITELSQLRQSIAESASRTSLNAAQREVFQRTVQELDKNIEYLSRTMDDRVMSVSYQNQATQTQTDYYKALTLTEDMSRGLKMRSLKAQADSLFASVQESGQRIALMRTQGKVNDQQVKNMIAQEAETWLKAQGVSLQNKNFGQYQRQIESEIYKNYQNRLSGFSMSGNVTPADYYLNGGVVPNGHVVRDK